MKKNILLILFLGFACLSANSMSVKRAEVDTIIFNYFKSDFKDLVKGKDKKFDSNIEIDTVTEKQIEHLADIGIWFSKSFNSGKPQNITIIKTSSDKTPIRVEKKLFTNISNIEIDQKYGNIVVRESNSKQVDLEIQYFDTKTDKATCDISISNSSSKGLLLIATTTQSSRGGSNPQINYILSIPQNTALTVNQKYGNIRLDDHNGKFTGNLSYSNLDAQSFGEQKPEINIKYGNVNINSVTDIALKASYSKTKIQNARNIEISDSKYSDFSLDNVEVINAVKSLLYNNFKIGTVSEMNANMLYTEVKIDKLISSFTSDCTYSDITLQSTGNKLRNITMDGSYSDLMIILPEGASAAFDASLSNGDISISKKHQVTYTQQSLSGFTVKKTGTIGNSKNPKAVIKVSNKYADIRIR